MGGQGDKVAHSAPSFRPRVPGGVGAGVCVFVVVVEVDCLGARDDDVLEFFLAAKVSEVEECSVGDGERGKLQVGREAGFAFPDELEDCFRVAGDAVLDVGEQG